MPTPNCCCTLSKRLSLVHVVSETAISGLSLGACIKVQFSGRYCFTIFSLDSLSIPFRSKGRHNRAGFSRIFGPNLRVSSVASNLKPKVIPSLIPVPSLYLEVHRYRFPGEIEFPWFGLDF